MSIRASLYYIHDPMCAWCWGYKPTFSQLIAALPADIELKYLVGGLAPDSDEPMPASMREAIPGYWRKIQNLLGTEFNFDFWTQCEPRRSTYPACRSVLAAKKQGKEVEMIAEIQYAYYLHAMNPSDNQTHIELAKKLDINVEQFTRDLLSKEIEALLQELLQFAHQLPIQGFPSLVLKTSDAYYSIPVDYKSEIGSLEAINECV